MNLQDTICAISTPSGEGGICVIRISGDRTFEIVHKLFYKDLKKQKKFSFINEASHTIHFGYLFDGAKVADEVLVSIFKNPNSYTGEDVIEISSHGGSFIAQKIISLLIKSGARHAGHGEFTRRAFLNGKIDLSQAEAVADLIKSKTESAHSSSIRQLEGSLSEFVFKTRQDIINIVSLVELELDFAEEGLEFIKKDEINSMILNLNLKLKNIISTYITGKVIREGVNLVIAGKPNSGKSSLFNHFLKSNRAIVSSIAGTTRDYIDESIIINGILFNLTDTAGLRNSSDEIESEGIKRSHKKIEEADLILYLIDSSRDSDEIKNETENFRNTFENENSILVYSKADLMKEKINDDRICISLLNEDTTDRLKTLMTVKINSSGINNTSDEIILTNLRHKICLENVTDSLNNASLAISQNMSGEFISIDLRSALSHLGEITGEVTNDDILNNVFRNFCIGK